MMRTMLIPMTVIVLLLSCFRTSEGLRSTDVPPLIEQFLAMHVQHHTFSNELSARTLSNYIQAFDYGKYYFYKSDIDEFAKYRDTIDDLAARGSFPFVKEIMARYHQRFKESLVMLDELTALKHDFSANEEMVVDREKVDWAATKDDMRERWRKYVKLQLLNYLSGGKNIEEARAKLNKKFKLLAKRNDEFTEEQAYGHFLNAFSMALDPHSNYMSWDEQEDFNISMRLKLEGIGVRLRSEDGFVFVESIIAGGAADRLPEKLKLKPNDKIIAVAQSDGEAEDVVDMDLRDVVKKIRGNKGTEVRLTVLRDDVNTHKPIRIAIPIIREEISLKDSAAEATIHTIEGPTPQKVGYVRLPSFYFDRESGKSSSGDMKKIIADMKNADVKAIVLDLRGNPGGLLDEAVRIAGYFIKSGPILQVIDSRNQPQVYADTSHAIVWDRPLVVLIDRFSASAAEILAGAIRDYRRGLLVGPTSTFGKGTVQTYNELPNRKGAVKITISIFYQPGGTSNQLFGIKPDIIIPDLTSIWDIGEEKSRFPLRWKRIPSAEFSPVNLVNPGMVTQLAERSVSRMDQSDEYRKLRERIAAYAKQVGAKTISLKEESGLEKQRKKEMEKTLNKDSGRKLIDLKNDLLLREAFQVTGDYLRILGR